MKENRKLLKEVLKDIRHDMTDEEVLNLLADSKISVSPESEKEKYFIEHLTQGFLKADTKERYESYKIGIESGFLTVEEVRQLENMNSKPEAEVRVHAF